MFGIYRLEEYLNILSTLETKTLLCSVQGILLSTYLYLFIDQILLRHLQYT